MPVTPTRRARALATSIRKARERSGHKGRTLSEKLGLSHSTVSHWETGKRIPNSEDVARFLGAIGVIGREYERILELARHASEPNWLTVGMPGIPEQLAGVVDCETDAHRITQWAPTLLPGILQTSAITRATLSTVEAFSPNDVESRVFIRLSRREALSEDKDTHLHALIGEPALREPLAPPEIMAEQLRYLLEASMRPNITIQVIRSGIGWHPGLHGPFVFYEFPDSDPVVYFEHFSLGAFVEDEDDVKEYRGAVGQLIRLSMDERDSHEFIARLAEQKEQT